MRLISFYQTELKAANLVAFVILMNDTGTSVELDVIGTVGGKAASIADPDRVQYVGRAVVGWLQSRYNSITLVAKPFNAPFYFKMGFRCGLYNIHQEDWIKSIPILKFFNDTLQLYEDVNSGKAKNDSTFMCFEDNCYYNRLMLKKSDRTKRDMIPMYWVSSELMIARDRDANIVHESSSTI
jgi:hypothetical protein